MNKWKSIINYNKIINRLINAYYVHNLIISDRFTNTIEMYPHIIVMCDYVNVYVNLFSNQLIHYIRLICIYKNSSTHSLYVCHCAYNLCNACINAYIAMHRNELYRYIGLRVCVWHNGFDYIWYDTPNGIMII